MQSTDADNPHSPELSSNSALTETEAALRLGLKVADAARLAASEARPRVRAARARNSIPAC